MRFGTTLRGSVYAPWKTQYIDYAKLKDLLRENKHDDDDVAWTEEDENRFSDELLNVQLEKVVVFQETTFQALRDRVDAVFDKLREITPAAQDGESPKGKERSEITMQRLKETQGELDDITNEVRELKKYSNVNHTGFLKIAKKHDRKRGQRYKIRPLMQVRLAKHPFNSEAGYAPLLSKLSIMYEAIRQYLHEEEVHPVDLDSQQPETQNGESYTAHKCKSNLLLQVCLVRVPAHPGPFSQSGFTPTTCSRSRR